MEDSRYYFLLGFMSAMLTAMLVISCTATPLNAVSDSECGKYEWDPCYVKIVE